VVSTPPESESARAISGSIARVTNQVEAVYEVVLLDAEEDATVFQFGAFTDMAEAQKVLDLLEAEGRHGPLSLNAVPVYASAADWQRDR